MYRAANSVAIQYRGYRVPLHVIALVQHLTFKGAEMQIARPLGLLFGSSFCLPMAYL